MRCAPHELAFFVALSACVASATVRVDSGTSVAEPPSGSLRFIYEQFDGAPGVLVKSVERGGAADRAGIAPGDCIMAVGGKPLVPDADLKAFYRSFSPGQRVTVDVVRDERAFTVDTILDAPTAMWRAPGPPTPVFERSPVCMKSIR